LRLRITFDDETARRSIYCIQHGNGGWQIGRDLQVRYVLEGSIERQGERIRTTAQLIDSETGAHVWSERWDRPALLARSSSSNEGPKAI
jgi:TolB-like protein